MDVKRDSFRRSGSSNRPERSNPVDMEMMSKAFICDGFMAAGTHICMKISGPGGDLRPFLNQELSMMPSVEILVTGLGSRIFASSLRASEENQAGHLNAALAIFLYISIRLPSWKGRYPASMTKRITPQDQMWCGAGRPVSLTLRGAQAKIRDLQVAVLIEEQVLWLEVPVVDSRLWQKSMAPTNLPLDLIHQPNSHHLLLVDHLYRHTLGCLDVARIVHLCKVPLPQ
ncbi:unnamed protein product [Spirodela intermedia]|uniref:Uncharacterized protein n=1 Tax=Spirodela intermedia TaxID=51605 RepID=A0A7I8JGK6_SPIIN|nr:unnamed protein product [Spirodela intermedia]CAA6669270.1 unnamed protein product [Spirodela intermedia]